MKLTILVDNKQSQKQLKCEHGLSFLLETDELNILFDTGQSDKFLFNAKKLGIDLLSIDYVVLSHGHYDHTGGLPAFLRLNNKARVIIHKHAFKERFSRSSSMIKENGIPWRDQSGIDAQRFMIIDEDLRLPDGTHILCNIKPQPGYEAINERLVVKNGNQYTPDQFDDELILVTTEKIQPSVLCGCAHTGIVNILHSISERLHRNTFNYVAGGLHLNGRSQEEIEHVINGLSPFKVNQWLLNHCTGDVAFERFAEAFPKQVQYAGSGHSFIY
ncbi:MBL fold metallo-hydrolase [Carboxylicivirga mesophila]|uniref:MBL fold metallo-hydrolase n=1 Tax=Carboxylicivirga mesophila TaxID=1166478 RepID=A0ABS5K7M9_9BACT|nr:MBL fold metallo-hydrolase [Carboxylicivirga mesophila]MBS2210511.1 MBL fold metallo-hydrolase [Carboxylicivirga mesophila]